MRQFFMGEFNSQATGISISVQNIMKAGAAGCFVTDIQHQGINTEGRCLCWYICVCGCICVFIYLCLPTLNYK